MEVGGGMQKYFKFYTTVHLCGAFCDIHHKNRTKQKQKGVPEVGEHVPSKCIKNSLQFKCSYYGWE